jgi:hypothetical protein
METYIPHKWKEKGAEMAISNKINFKLIKLPN